MTPTSSLYAGKAELLRYFGTRDDAINAVLVKAAIGEQQQATRLLLALGNGVVPAVSLRVKPVLALDLPLAWYSRLFCDNRDLILALLERLDLVGAKARHRALGVARDLMDSDEATLGRLHALRKTGGAAPPPRKGA